MGAVMLWKQGEIRNSLYDTTAKMFQVCHHVFHSLSTGKVTWPFFWDYVIIVTF